MDNTNAWNDRMQRFMQNDFDMGVQPVIFVREKAAEGRSKLEGTNKWIPDVDKVVVETYKKSRAMAYLLPVPYDHLGLKRVMREHDCAFVHAHNLPCAYYSRRLGFPTLFNDWEYHYSYYDYEAPHLCSKWSRPFRFYRRNISKNIVKKILPFATIVTNKNVERRYRELGAEKIWTVPNVPSKFEIDFASKFSVEKRKQTTTCYVGEMSADSKIQLRNTSGIRELWMQNDLGELLVLEGENYIHHLQIFGILKSCHYNLLYWKPLNIHQYYLQNKAFLASVIGIPTIISESLTATIELLGDLAIPVNSLEDVKKVVQSELWKHNHSYPKPSHIFEYYSPKIREAYQRMND